MAILVGLAGAVGTAARAAHTLALATPDLTPLHQRINRLPGLGRRGTARPARSSPTSSTCIRAGVDHLATFLQSLISQPGVRPAGTGDRLARRGRRWPRSPAYAAGNLAGARCSPAPGSPCLGPARAVAGEHGHPGADPRGGAHLRAGRGTAGHLVGPVARDCAGCVTPVLDFMQTMPTFVYLAPLTLFFLIGPASGVIATLDLRDATGHPDHRARHPRGARARRWRPASSLGATRWQLLRQVRLPLARRMIVVGINQTTMCALSMVTIAALIDAPGPGPDHVGRRCSACDVGTRVQRRAGHRHPGGGPGPGHHRGRRTGRAPAPRPAGRSAGAGGSRWPSCGGLTAGRAVPRLHRATGRRSSRGPGRLVGPRSAAAVGRRRSTAASDFPAALLRRDQRRSRTPSPTGCSTRWRTCSPRPRGTSPARCAGPAGGGARRGARTCRWSRVCLALLIGTGLWQAAMATLAATLVATARDHAARRRWSGCGWAAPTGRRPGDPPGPGRRAGDAGVRLPRPVRGPVRSDPVHRASSRPSCSPRRWSIKLVAEGIRAVPADRGRGGHRLRLQRLAAHHQGAAAAGPPVASRWPPTRA